MMLTREKGSVQENVAELDVMLDTLKDPGGLGGPAIRRVVTISWNLPKTLPTSHVN